MQHDASRCVQGVFQFGNEEQRREVVMELCDAGSESGSSSSNARSKSNKATTDERKNNLNMNMADLCKIQYAHFVVLKMINYCAKDEVCVKLIVKSLKKQMTKLAVHSVGSRVLELLFASFPPKSTAPLKLELYGPQYALFASAMPPSEGKGTTGNNAPTLPTLATFIANNPDKLEPTLAYLQTILQKGLDKSLTGFAYFHSFLLDYTSIAPPNDIRSFLAPALAEHSLHLLSTRAGTKVVCECCAYGTVKDRKRMMKCIKGYTRSSLLHRDAYLAVLRMCDVMDDTVLVNKTLLAELHRNSDLEKAGGAVADDDNDDKDKNPSPILDLVLSDTGSKLLLLLLMSKEEKHLDKDDKSTAATPRWQKYFDPYELSVLHRNPVITENGDDAVPTSKKADETRRQELLVYLKDLLIEVCTKHVGEIMRSKPGSRVLMEVCDNFPSEELFSAIVEACAESCCRKDVKNEIVVPMVEDPVGHLALKHIFISESKKEFDDDEPSLARIFYSKFEKNLGRFASSNRGAFVLSALLQTFVKEDVKKALQEHKKTIAKLAKGSKDKRMLAGCGILLEALA